MLAIALRALLVAFGVAVIVWLESASTNPQYLLSLVCFFITLVIGIAVQVNEPQPTNPQNTDDSDGNDRDPVERRLID